MTISIEAYNNQATAAISNELRHFRISYSDDGDDCQQTKSFVQHDDE